MKRKKLVIVVALIALIGGGTGIYFATKKPTSSPAAGSPVAGKAQGGRKIKYYKSSMMLGQISQTPQKDSMGMDMVPVYEDEAGDTSVISIDPVTVQNMGVRLGTVTRGPLRRIVRTVGHFQANETTLTDVTTKFKGWIENLYVDATGKEVKKGEPLFDIYSPDLYSAQNEYLLALKGPANLKQSALTRLKYFDISDEQIAELEKTGKGTKTLQVKVPADGVVLEKMAVEGQMVEAGMKLYRLADLSIVWLQSQIYEQDLAYVRLGQEAVASLSYLPDRKFRGRVTYVYPTVDEKTRTTQVRMEFHNPGLFLKPGMFATVELEAELDPSALLVPDTAILRSGAKTTVFVALEGGKFEPRTVVLGPRSENNLYQVLSGLKEGERVVTSGQFMLDSESQLREAIQKMMEPATVAKASEHAGHKMPPETDPHAEHQSKEEPKPIAPATQPSSTYICPMPEHASIEYDHPGKCPICGMTLIPKPNESSSVAAAGPTATPTPATEHQH